MNYSEVKELLSAGFTVEEIRGMLNPQANNAQNSQGNPQEENTNVSETATENSSENLLAKSSDQLSKQHDPAGAPAENTNIPKFDQLNATMEKLIRTIQTSNFNNSSFDAIKETDINKQVDQIMGSIIRPEREKEER